MHALLRRPWLLGTVLVAVVALLVGGAAAFGSGSAPARARRAGRRPVEHRTRDQPR